MNERKPALHFDPKRGRYYMRWGRRVRYFRGTKRDARTWYTEQLVEWAQWRAERQQQIAYAMTPRKRYSIADLADRFLDEKQAGGDVSDFTIRWYKGSLKWLLINYGGESADRLTAPMLNSFKLDRLAGGSARRTVAHEIGATKAMIQWAVDNDLIRPINLRAVKAPKLSPPEPKGYSLETFRFMAALAQKHSENLANWITLNWMLLARPTEMVRLVAGEGKWDEPYLYRLTVSKTRNRWLIFTPTTHQLLKACRLSWTHYYSYSRAITRTCGPGGPHPLRHGAATYLHRVRKVDRATVDLILGHYPSRVSLTYSAIDWQSLRQTANLLGP